jgi:hypothetical protein
MLLSGGPMSFTASLQPHQTSWGSRKPWTTFRSVASVMSAFLCSACHPSLHSCPLGCLLTSLGGWPHVHLKEKAGQLPDTFLSYCIV